MINATQLRPGMIIIQEAELYRVTSVKHITPGNWRGMVQTKLKSLRTGNGTEQRFRSEDRLEKAQLEQHSMQFLYHEDGQYHFMNTETFEQTSLSGEEVGALKNFLASDMIVEMDFYEGRPVGIELPSTIELAVTETEPGLKGATASNSFKPATLETGVVIQVPPFIQIGDRIRVDPVEERYLERVKAS
jgi:elongation factor P